jgi:hypothetical protein
MEVWLLCRLDDDGIVHSKSFFVKRRSQPLEKHRPKKLLDKSVMLPCPGQEFPSVRQLGGMIVFRTAASGSRGAIRP